MTEKIRKSSSANNEVPVEEINDLDVGKNDHAENL